jgi:hypothetical protein
MVKVVRQWSGFLECLLMRLNADNALFPCITLATVSPRRFVVIPLILTCIAIVIAIALAAARGKFHMPGYLGLAGLTFVVSIIVGKTAGSRHITGTPVGIILSVIFYLLISAALGSVISLFVYRRPPDS